MAARRINLGTTTRRIDPATLAKALGAEIVVDRDTDRYPTVKEALGKLVATTGGICLSCVECQAPITPENDSGWCLVEPWGPKEGQPVKPLCKACDAKILGKVGQEV